MLLLRVVKIALVASIALFASLVAFGNVTDYDTNFEFVRHVLMMDTTFPHSGVRYRAISSPADSSRSSAGNPCLPQPAAAAVSNSLNG